MAQRPTLTLHTALKERNWDTIDHLLRTGDAERFSQQNDQGQTPLHIAASEGLEQAVASMIAQDTPLNPQDNQKRNPLHCAASAQRYKICDMLLRARADATALTSNDNSPLSLLALESSQNKDRIDVLRRMIIHGANPNQQNSAGETALSRACESGDLTVVELLLSRSASLLLPRKDENMVHAATRGGNVEVLRRVILARGNPNAVRQDGKKPQDIATSLGHHECAQLLERLSTPRGLQNFYAEFETAPPAPRHARANSANAKGVMFESKPKPPLRTRFQKSHTLDHITRPPAPIPCQYRSVDAETPQPPMPLRTKPTLPPRSNHKNQCPPVSPRKKVRGRERGRVNPVAPRTNGVHPSTDPRQPTPARRGSHRQGPFAPPPRARTEPGSLVRPQPPPVSPRKKPIPSQNVTPSRPSTAPHQQSPRNGCVHVPNTSSDSGRSALISSLDSILTHNTKEDRVSSDELSHSVSGMVESHREATKNALRSLGKRAEPYQEAIRRKLTSDEKAPTRKPRVGMPVPGDDNKESERLKPMQLPPSGKLNVTPPSNLATDKVPAWQSGEEIIFSESQYVRQIGIAIGVRDPPKFIVPKEEIYSVSKKLLQSLEEQRAITDPEERTIGSLFLRLVPHLSLYSDYCTNRNASRERLMALRAQDPMFDQFLECARCDPSGRGEDLEGFLIKPFQRICRYVLLLKELQKVSSPSWPDYPNLSKAIQSIDSVVRHANENKRMMENDPKPIQDRQK